MEVCKYKIFSKYNRAISINNRAFIDAYKENILTLNDIKCIDNRIEKSFVFKKDYKINDKVLCCFEMDNALKLKTYLNDSMNKPVHCFEYRSIDK